MTKKIMLLLIVIFYLTPAKSQNGLQMFDNSFVHDIRITSPYPDLYDTLEAHYSTVTFDATYIMCSIQIDGLTIDSIGLKEKGLSSNFIPGLLGKVKKPLKVDFGNYISGQLYDGLNKINLANEYYDPSVMHNPIAFKALNDAGVAAPRTSYAKVYFNNVYWGLYIVIEQVDKIFLDNHFPDHNGNLYKGYASQSGLNWLGSSNIPYLLQYEQQLKHNGDTSYSDIIHLCDITNNSGANYYDSVTTNMDMTSFLKSMAVDYLLKNSDGLVVSGHNFYLYHSTTDNKFYWIPWDENQAYSYSDYKLLDTLGNSKPVFYNATQNAILRNNYFDYVCEISNNIVTPTNLFPFIDSTYNLIRNDFIADTNKLYSLTAFDSVINYNIQFNPAGTFLEESIGLKPLMNSSHDSAYAELSSYGDSCTLTTNTVEVKNDEMKIYPNPFSNKFTVDNSSNNELTEITLYDITSRKLLHQTFSSTITLNTAQLAKGIYFYQARRKNIVVKSGKTIKQ